MKCVQSRHISKDRTRRLEAVKVTPERYGVSFRE